MSVRLIVLLAALLSPMLALAQSLTQAEKEQCLDKAATAGIAAQWRDQGKTQAETRAAAMQGAPRPLDETDFASINAAYTMPKLSPKEVMAYVMGVCHGSKTAANRLILGR